MLPKWGGYYLQFLPTLQGSLGEVIRKRREANGGPEGDLRDLEAAGASPGDLAHLVEKYYFAGHATFRGLGSGFTPRSSFPPCSPRMAIWALDQLADPWPVLQALGSDREEMIRYLLGNAGPEDWLRWWAELGIPEPFRALVGTEGFQWQGPEPIPPVPWFPNPLGGGLDLSALDGPAPIPEGFIWRNMFALRNCSGLGILRVGGGNNLRIENCPGLKAVLVTTAIDRLEISDCPDLCEVVVPEGCLEIRRCSSLRNLYLERAAWIDDGVSTRFPWANGHRPEGSLYLEDCPVITSIDAPQGSLHVHRCESLKTIFRRGSGDLRVEDCGRIQRIRMGPGSVWVSNCPGLEILHRDGTGELRVQGCASLITIATRFAKDTFSRDEVVVRDCPELAELRSLSQKLHHCGAVTLAACPKLHPPLPCLRTHGPLAIEGCPSLGDAGIERRGAGWLLGASVQRGALE